MKHRHKIRQYFLVTYKYEDIKGKGTGTIVMQCKGINKKRNMLHLTEVEKDLKSRHNYSFIMTTSISEVGKP
jgi:hypothetical protein